MSFIKETEIYLKDVLKKCGYELDEIVLESSQRRDLGEFQINCAMSLAKKYGKTEGQIILNWHHKLGVVPIPATSRPWRIKEHLEALKINMDDKDYEDICNFAINGRKKKFVVGNKYFGVNILG